MVAAFTDAGHAVSLDLADGPQLRECLVATARRNDIDVLAACGGDGTISTAAGLLRHRPIALGVLPGGTMNMYARTLGCRSSRWPPPRCWPMARCGTPTAPPLPASSSCTRFHSGFQPHVIRRREQMKYGSRIEKLAAGARSLLATLRDPPQFTVEMVLDGDPRLLSTSALVVSNNVYGDDHLPFADELDGGILGIYAATTINWSDLAEIGAALVLGVEEPPENHRRNGTARAHQAAAKAAEPRSPCLDRRRDQAVSRHHRDRHPSQKRESSRSRQAWRNVKAPFFAFPGNPA